MSRLALQLYGLARRSGLLRTRAGDALFVRSYFAYKRLIEDPFATLVRVAPHLFAGGHILDVGANLGYTASVFASAKAPGFRVFAFEPDEDNFAHLRRIGDIEAVRAAVGERDGAVRFWHNAHHHGDHRVATTQSSAVTEVPMTTLDRFVAERALSPIAFVKIDVQGYEPAVIAGMKDVIAGNPNVTIAAEFAPESLADFGFAPADTLDPLLAAGFTPHVLRQGRLVEVAKVDAGKRGYVDVVWRRVPSRALF